MYLYRWISHLFKLCYKIVMTKELTGLVDMLYNVCIVTVFLITLTFISITNKNLMKTLHLNLYHIINWLVV